MIKEVCVNFKLEDEHNQARKELIVEIDIQMESTKVIVNLIIW